MRDCRAVMVLIGIAILLLSTGCIADDARNLNPPETQQENPQRDDSDEETQEESLQPKDISVENLDENNHTFKITVVDTENETTIYSGNLTLLPQTEMVVEEVTSKKGEYKVTVRTENGLSEEFSWRIDRNHHDLVIIYDSNLRITQSVN